MTATEERPNSQAHDNIPEGLIALWRRQIDAINQIARIALHGTRDVAARQPDIISKLHRQIFDLVSCSLAWPAVEDGMVSGVAFARQAVGISIAHSIALIEITAKMEMHALTILNKSVSVSLDGVSSALQRMTPRDTTDTQAGATGRR
jgi:hypothetical protein